MKQQTEFPRLQEERPRGRLAVAAVARKIANEQRQRYFFLALILLGIGTCAEIAAPLRSIAARPPAGGNEARARARDIASADLRKGRRLFIRDCAHCHGRSGDGNSPVRRTLHPTPLDLTGFDFTASFVLKVLHEGVPGSDMPAWHLSPEEDLRAVSAYTAQLGRPDQLPETDRFAPPEALQEAGRRIYAMHCARCHGEQGNGDGKDATRYRPGPPSLQGMQPSYAAAKRIIEKGVPGTAMASWPLLTQPEIQAVTYYIRSLYSGGRRESSGITGATP
jgi:mono/diheme cytochrome c family protein